MEISFCFHSIRGYEITIFAHAMTAQLLCHKCAKFCITHFLKLSVRAKQNFQCFGIMMENRQ